MQFWAADTFYCNSRSGYVSLGTPYTRPRSARPLAHGESRRWADARALLQTCGFDDASALHGEVGENGDGLRRKAHAPFQASSVFLRVFPNVVLFPPAPSAMQS